jgi:hypothetical protein
MGARFCADGHKNPLLADCCTTCGTTKLTKGVKCLSLRFGTWLALLISGYFFVPVLLRLVLTVGSQLFWRVADAVIPLLVALAIVTFFLGPIVGFRGMKVMFDLWLGFFKLIVQVLQSTGIFLIQVLRNWARQRKS